RRRGVLSRGGRASCRRYRIIERALAIDCPREPMDGTGSPCAEVLDLSLLAFSCLSWFPMSSEVKPRNLRKTRMDIVRVFRWASLRSSHPTGDRRALGRRRFPAFAVLLGQELVRGGLVRDAQLLGVPFEQPVAGAVRDVPEQHGFGQRPRVS